MTWELIPVPRTELDLAACLNCGQTFKWIETDRAVWYLLPLTTRTSVLDEFLISLRQSDHGLEFKCHNSTDMEAVRNVLYDYFRLEIEIEQKYKEWAERDKNFSLKMKNMTGIRMLRQDPIETIFSFICSSNNHISRISKMVCNLISEYGDLLGKVGEHSFHKFPPLQRLCEPSVEARLKELGFGYRAKFIPKSAKHLSSLNRDMKELRSESYENCLTLLLELSGVGQKVADCICLMSLDKLYVVPVDTHVWQIAKRDYKLDLKAKTVNANVCRVINAFFVNLFGDLAGWAHTV